MLLWELRIEQWQGASSRDEGVPDLAMHVRLADAICKGQHDTVMGVSMPETVAAVPMGLPGAAGFGEPGPGLVDRPSPEGLILPGFGLIGAPEGEPVEVLHHTAASERPTVGCAPNSCAMHLHLKPLLLLCRIGGAGACLSITETNTTKRSPPLVFSRLWQRPVCLDDLDTYRVSRPVFPSRVPLKGHRQ